MMTLLRVVVLAAAVMCSGCFIDDLWSDHDDGTPAVTDRQWTRNDLIPEGSK